MATDDDNRTTAVLARCWWEGGYQLHWWTENYAGEEATLFGTFRDFVVHGHETEVLKFVRRLPDETYSEFTARMDKYLPRYAHLLESELS